MEPYWLSYAFAHAASYEEEEPEWPEHQKGSFGHKECCVLTEAQAAAGLAACELAAMILMDDEFPPYGGAGGKVGSANP